MKPILLFIIMIISPSQILGQNSEALEPEDFFNRMTNPDIVILDVRTPEEFNLGHIENAILIDYRSENFLSQLKKLEQSKTYLIYCRSGARSISTLEILKSLGYKNLYELNGGITQWIRKGYSLVGEKEDMISAKEYQKILLSFPIILIEFYTPWCSSCNQMDFELNELEKNYKEKIQIVKINADENRNLVQSFSKREFPILIAYKNQKIEWEKSGYIKKQKLIEYIENLIR